jgi:hypothetical protein
VTSRPAARLDRLYDRIGRRVPQLAGFLRWARRPTARLVRVPIGVLLVCGGVLSALPILGVWMLPLGLLLLAVDVPPLQTPVAWAIIKGHRWWELRQRRKRTRQARPADQR